MVWGAIAGAATAVGSAIFGAGQQDKAEKSAKKAAEEAQKAQEKAIKKQYNYDVKAYGMAKEQIIAKRDEQIRAIDLARKNESIIAQYKDATASANYQYGLQIRNLQQKQLNDQYIKSEQLYRQQIGWNDLTAKYAKETQLRAVVEEAQKFAFANQENILESLAKESTARLRGSGRSARKAAQSQLAALGRNQAGLAESLVSLQTNAAAALRNIDMQHLQADLGAFAQRMLPPDAIPAPVVPFKTPLTEYQYPRELQAFDFGPKPIRGTKATATGGAAGGGWATAFAKQLPAVASAVTPLVQQLFQPTGNAGSFSGFNLNNIDLSGKQFANLSQPTTGFGASSGLGIASSTGFNLNQSFFK